MSLNRQINEFMTVREAAEAVGLSKRQTRRLTIPGAPLEAARLNPVLIERSRVEAFAAARKEKR